MVLTGKAGDLGHQIKGTYTEAASISGRKQGNPGPEPRPSFTGKKFLNTQPTWGFLHLKKEGNISIERVRKRLTSFPLAGMEPGYPKKTISLW